MPARLTVTQPDISFNPQTNIAVDYASGNTLTVFNTNGFGQNEYVILGDIGGGQTEVVQVSSVDSPTQFTISTPSFTHAADTPVTRIDYNQFRVYRSTTGVGGSYSLIATIPLMVDSIYNEYTDTTAATGYAYKFAYFNSYNNVQSTYSSEVPFGGYPMYSLRSIQDQVIDLFGDFDGKFITRDMITNWANECTSRLQFMLTGGMSPYFIDSQTITSTQAYSYDLSAYNMVQIFLIEYSTDGGITYGNQVNFLQFGFPSPLPSAGAYSARLGGDTLFFDQPLPMSYVMRIWFWTNPTLLTQDSSYLPAPLQGHSEMYVNYCLKRANEKDRKFAEAAAYFKSEFQTHADKFIPLLKQRIQTGNTIMATTWSDDYTFGGY